MEIFDPQRKRAVLDQLSSDGRRNIERGLNYPVGELIAQGTLGRVAGARLNDAIKCLLVNYDTDAERHLECAREWALIAMERNERADDVSAHYHASLRFDILAMCRWLMDGTHDQKYLDGAVQASEAHYQVKDGKDKVGVSLGIPPYVDAAAWALCDERLDIAGFSAHPKLTGLRNEAALARVYCDHHLRDMYSPDQVRAATERSLNSWMNRWLASDGAYTRAAQWLKITHWRADCGLAPKEIVMKAYDYLPNVDPESVTDS